MADAEALREAGVPSRLPTASDSLVASPGAAPLTPAPAAAPPAEEKVMTLVDHLTELRNRIFICVAAVALLFFLIGVAVAWVVLPFALQFLVGFESKDFHFLPTAEAYFGFITTLFLAFGLTMEFPIVLVLLSKVGIITSQRLRSSRRIV